LKQQYQQFQLLISLIRTVDISEFKLVIKVFLNKS